MKSVKTEQTKDKSKSKKPCNSKQASKFLEKEGFNNFSLNFKGLAVSLNDFIPNQSDDIKDVPELDFDIGKQMKKLEKKDPGTKQKALVELIEMINQKDNKSIVSMLRYWPKMYNKLSVDEDKKVRELTQELMGLLANLCGKNLGIYIKQLLPTWIFSQSDVHTPVSKLAIQSFNNTFTDEIRRQKAYLLCWDEISVMISTSFNRPPIKDKVPLISKEKKSEALNEESSVITKKISLKEKADIDMKDDSIDLIGTTEKATSNASVIDSYVNDLVLHLRTLVTLLPYIAKDDTATNDITKWIHSKTFWAHYTTSAPINIVAIYLNFSVDLIKHTPQLVLNNPFVESHIAQAFRYVDNYHSTIMPLTWTTIIKLIDVIGAPLWHHISYQNTFLPKWLKMLECGSDGRVSLSASFMLPFFTKMPLDVSKTDSTVVYTRIFDAMIKGFSCPRVKHNSHESNCLLTTILECGTYTVLSARMASNDVLKNKTLDVMWTLLEHYLTDIEYSKADKTITQFCVVALRPLLNKGVLTTDQVINYIIIWIEKYYTIDIFSENLAELVTELSQIQVSDDFFCATIMKAIETVLIQKVIDTQHCLLPYLGVISSSKVSCATQEHKSQLRHVMKHCKDVISVHSSSVTTTISLALANILNNLIDEADQLFEKLLTSLSRDQINIFFSDFYQQFLSHVHEDISIVMAATSLRLWKETLDFEFNIILSTDSEAPTQEVSIQRTLSLFFKQCQQSLIHRDHLTDIIKVLDANMARAAETLISGDSIDTMISLAKFVIDEMNLHFILGLVPQSMVHNLIKILLSVTADSTIDISQLKMYLDYCIKNHYDVSILLDVLDEVLLGDNRQLDIGVALISMILNIGLVEHEDEIISHIFKILENDMLKLSQIVNSQRRYSLTVVHQQQPTICVLMNKLHYLIPLHYDSHTSLNQLKNYVDHCCVLVTPVLFATFSNCHHSTHILNQCESIYAYTQTVINDKLTTIIDLMILSSKSKDVVIFDQCYNLVLVALNHFIPGNYSLWSKSLLSLVDLAIDNWTDQSLSEKELAMIFQVLIPSAVRARYIIQEIVLATISSFLSEDINPTLDNINRAILLVKSLTVTDTSYFTVCYPLIMNVKHIFENHIDQLYDASVDTVSSQFDLSSLLEILIVGVDSPQPLSQSQWDFVLCLISTLSRSTQFINSGDFTTATVSNNADHIFNSVLLLRLISNVTIALASVNNESVLDEWDNFFSEPIFTTILDMFSLVAGDHTHGKLVVSDLFTFYTESLAEVVSLCPVNILLTHNFSSQIHINDPIELPKNFLLVFNSLLESLSSYSLSTQLAAYNCLLNLTDHLSSLLLEQITNAESNDSLESFSINLPYKLLCYLQSDDLTQLTVDKLENEIVLTRCFLAWSILLQLFSCSQAKVRAEISTFLVSHNRTFDKFLSFCYMFMPKSPLVSKKHLTFLAVQNKQCCNLISEEPQIFSKCLEKRTKFIIYHLSSYVFRRSLQVLPNLSRCWFMALDGNSQQQVDAYVRQFLTPELLKTEFAQLKKTVGVDFDEKLEIQALPVIGEVTVRYIVPGDQCLEQVITVPNNYPIGKVAIDFKKEMTVKIPHWKSWIIQMTSTMQNQNGSIVDGVKLWKKNLDNHFDGIEECMICYSILHAVKYTLPSMKCRQCKKKFHKDCMYKWFQSSTNPTCPNCRNVFYDGTYKRAQYGDNDL